jgi:hypothetical protein
MNADTIISGFLLGAGSKVLDDIFDMGCDVLGTSRNQAGTILAQTGDVVGEEVASDDAEWDAIRFDDVISGQFDQDDNAVHIHCL